MLICSHTVLPRYFYIIVHIKQNEDVLQMHATGNPPEKGSLLYAHFLHEVLKQLYLEKMKQHFQNKRDLLPRHLIKHSKLLKPIETAIWVIISKCHPCYF